ncbi:hypothetical protein PV390_25635 [Streptomyces sp. ME02-6991-2A]|uniref:hypothetical protein n=1 Tax=Streptomyces sp. ME02-6991-2A TaxID=3028677 RepID=UPI0029A4A5E8|nr:hypothetical protein [Streptomyces sp. ME02-6991-2A]MDX3377787.1 hypothetical protein [Streptomyces sp. ME02-6991-2A]
MGGSVMDVVHGALLAMGGSLVAVIGGQSWRRKSSAPVSGGPLWVVRVGALGWVLMGCAVASLGEFSLAGREEDWPLGPARDVGLVLMLFSMAVGIAVRLHRRYAGWRDGRDSPGRV